MKLFMLLCLTGVCLGFEDKTLYQYFVDNGFNTFVSAINRAGVRNLFEGVASDPHTVFAPTDAAFIKAGLISLNFFTHEQLVAIVEYTMIPGFVFVGTVFQTTSYNTVNNQSLTLEPVPPTLRLNNVSMVADYIDIVVNNGVVQAVDTVLTPPIWPTRPPPTTPPTLTIYQLILRDDQRFADLTLALLLADVYQELDASEFTFFAPTDAAFAPYKNNLLDPNDPNFAKLYKATMEYHMVPGQRLSTDLISGSQLFTLHGTPLNVTVGTDVLINNGKVIEADILATNGVIHVIDHLLIPQDINQIAQG